MAYLSLSTDMSTCDIVWENLWHFDKVFSAYFHKLSMVTYENNLIVYKKGVQLYLILCYRKSLFIISYAITCNISCLSKHDLKLKISVLKKKNFLIEFHISSTSTSTLCLIEGYSIKLTYPTTPLITKINTTMLLSSKSCKYRTTQLKKQKL